jgi:hypothetical protein
MKTPKEYINASSERLSEELDSLISDDTIGIEGALEALISGVDSWITYYEKQAYKWKEFKQKLKDL